jgi:hypothetical protein
MVTVQPWSLKYSRISSVSKPRQTVAVRMLASR